MKPQILVYGRAADSTEEWQEELLSTQCQTAADVERIKALASQDGFHSFRVTAWDGRPPNFGQTINVGRSHKA